MQRTPLFKLTEKHEMTKLVKHPLKSCTPETQHLVNLPHENGLKQIQAQNGKLRAHLD